MSNIAIDIQLLPTQYEFIESDKPITAFIGGVGSGKSYGLGIWILLMAHQYPNCTGMITANTYKQLRDATLQTLFEICDEYNIRYNYKVNGELTINDTKILCRSVDNFNNLRGPSISWLACDETAFYDKAAWDVLVGRLRQKNGPLQIKMSTTPNGFNWLYDLLVLNGSEKKKLITSSSLMNTYLPSSYIDSLKENYDSRLYEQEVNGAFIDISGLNVYHAFDRRLHVKEFDIDPRVPWYVGQDFNIDPATSVKVYYNKHFFYVTDELFLRNSNTFVAADEIMKWGPAIIYPDSTGSARRSSSNKTDHQILKERGHTVKETHNPLVKDRYNCINNHFQKGRIFIHPRCKYLINDLEKMTHNNKDPMISHISDALGYVLWGIEPLQQERPRTKVINM